MGTRKAVVIGINDYPNGANLHGAVRDAKAISGILERNGDGSKNFDVKPYINVKTANDLIGLVNIAFQGDHDISLLYFSGHGYADSKDTYLVTPDYQPLTPGVSMELILKTARESGSRNNVIILDCCHSGAFGNMALFGGNAAVIYQGMTILTASKSNELSWEVNGMGVFTNLLLRALEGGAADIQGNITPGSIYAYVDQALGAFDQRPVFKTNVTKFTPLRKAKPPIDLDVLLKIKNYFPDPNKDRPLDPSYEKTNSKEELHLLLEPYADPEKVAVFQDLQQFASLGLVVPVDTPHMYYAAMLSKSCRLTPLGLHYWSLVDRGRL